VAVYILMSSHAHHALIHLHMNSSYRVCIWCDTLVNKFQLLLLLKFPTSGFLFNPFSVLLPFLLLLLLFLLLLHHHLPYSRLYLWTQLLRRYCWIMVGSYTTTSVSLPQEVDHSNCQYSLMALKN